MIPLRIFSDLHLGHPATTVDRVDRLFPLFEGVQRAWFNGDTVETCSESLAAASLDQLALLTSRLDQLGVEATWLPGNHDPDRPGPALATLENNEVVVTHGDICFRFGSPWSPWVPRIRDRLIAAETKHGGWDRPRGLDELAALTRDYALAFQPRPRRFTGWAGKLETILHASWPPSTPLAILDIWKNGPARVAGWMQSFTPQARVLIMGHTHRAGCWRHDGRWVLNTGAFHPFTAPRVIDVHPGRLVIRRVCRQHGQFLPGPTVVCLVRTQTGWEREGGGGKVES